VAASETSASFAADRVDLVDEDDRSAQFPGGVEHVADPAGADAYEHLHEVRARDGHERHSRLACNGTGDERLTGSRRADQ
jgi:hypothetical protein